MKKIWNLNKQTKKIFFKQVKTKFKNKKAKSFQIMISSFKQKYKLIFFSNLLLINLIDKKNKVLIRCINLLQEGFLLKKMCLLATIMILQKN